MTLENSKYNELHKYNKSQQFKEVGLSWVKYFYLYFIFYLIFLDKIYDKENVNIWDIANSFSD